MLTGVERFDGLLRVKRDGGGEAHRVDLGVFQEFLVIVIHADAAFGAPAVAIFRVQVTNGDEIDDAGKGGGRLDESDAAPGACGTGDLASTDDGEFQWGHGGGSLLLVRSA